MAEMDGWRRILVMAVEMMRAIFWRETGTPISMLMRSMASGVSGALAASSPRSRRSLMASIRRSSLAWSVEVMGWAD
jgi:hypothetical protein